MFISKYTAYNSFFFPVLLLLSFASSAQNDSVVNEGLGLIMVHRLVGPDSLRLERTYMLDGLLISEQKWVDKQGSYIGYSLDSHGRKKITTEISVPKAREKTVQYHPMGLPKSEGVYNLNLQPPERNKWPLYYHAWYTDGGDSIVIRWKHKRLITIRYRSNGTKIIRMCTVPVHCTEGSMMIQPGVMRTGHWKYWNRDGKCIKKEDWSDSDCS